MTQELFNIVVGVAGALGGWWLKVMWETLKDLQTADKELMDKVSKIEVLVAGAYVKRDEFDRALNRLFEKLDHIDSKLDSKADK
jgi:hypothetical protein